MTDDVSLEVEGLTVTYGGVRAVDAIDFRVDPGEVVALLGPNGAGKSSTLRAITGLTPAAGTVRFMGQDLRRRSAEAIARMGLLHVPEGRHVFPTLTVNENLLVGQTARAGRQAAFGLDDVYDLFPALADLRERGGWALSGGEQQMLAIARALVGAPRMLLLDEPSLGLAPIIVQSVFAALADIRSRLPILLVEQNTTVALGIASRAYVLVEGSIALSGTPDELGDRQAMLDSFLGQSDIAAG